MTGGLFNAFGNARLNEAGEVLFWARRTANIAGGNDECENAIPIGLGPTLFTTRDATDSLPFSCAWHSDVWFEFTDVSGNPSTQVRFSVTGADFTQPGAEIFGGACGELVPLGCSTATEIATVVFSEGMRTVKVRVGSTFATANQSGEAVLVVHQYSPAIGPLPSTSVTDGALWSDAGAIGDSTPILQEGSVVAFDPTLIHESMSIAAFTDFGSAITVGLQAMPLYINSRAAVMSLETGTVGVGVIALDPVPPATPPPPPYLPVVPGPASLSAEGDAAYALLDGSSVVYGETVHLTGTAAPGFDLQRWRNFDQPSQSRSGNIAWRSRLEGDGVNESNDVALWKDAGDAGGGIGPQLVARTGNPAPMAKPGVVFAQIGADVGVGDTGGTAFWGEVSGAGVDASNRAGIWSDRGGTLAPVVRAGSPAGESGQAGAVFSTFSRRPMMNNAGDIAVLAFVAGGDTTIQDNSGLWLFRADGTRRLVVREGQAVPGVAEGVVFNSLSDPVINDRGDLAFLATLRGGDVLPTTAQVLFFAGAGRGLVQVARAGDAVDVGGSSRTVREILFGSGRPQGGHGQFNSDAVLLYELVFTDRSRGLFKTAVICPADFDGSGIVLVPDIFAYLSAWFGQLPSAEWDGVPGIDASDIFAFLAQWFEGC